jgi:hypothetical protein
MHADTDLPIVTASPSIGILHLFKPVIVPSFITFDYYVGTFEHLI